MTEIEYNISMTNLNKTSVIKMSFKETKEEQKYQKKLKRSKNIPGVGMRILNDINNLSDDDSEEDDFDDEYDAPKRYIK